MQGVPLTHSNLVASMNNISQTYRLTPKDTVLLSMPLFHVHGLMSALLSTLATGGCVILPPQPKFSASLFWHNGKMRVLSSGRLQLDTALYWRLTYLLISLSLSFFIYLHVTKLPWGKQHGLHACRQFIKYCFFVTRKIIP